MYQGGVQGEGKGGCHNQQLLQAKRDDAISSSYETEI